MKKFKKIVAFILAIACMLSLTGISASAAKNPWDYSSTPTRAIYYKSPVMKGDDVKWVQQALNITISAKLSVDGSFGPASKKAVQTFQKKNKLAVDGSFGPATRKKMVEVLNKMGYKETRKKVNYLQSDSKWRYKSYNNSYLQDSGCGILSIVNAAYNCGGKFIQPEDVAKWALNSKYFNQAKKGGGICKNEVFSEAAKKFGQQYGFKYVTSGSNINSATLKNHLKNGGTAIVHVEHHYMCLVDYNSSTGKFLVFDSAPGSGTNYNSKRRKGLTSAKGDWKTAKQLSTGAIKVDGYWLYAKR